MVELALAEEVREAEADLEPEQVDAAKLCYRIPWVGVKVYGFEFAPVLPKKGRPWASSTIPTALE
jgi:hypothetical protein